MATFKYSLDIGSYSDDVVVDIDVTIKDGLEQEDYEKIRQALKVVEDTALAYVPTVVIQPTEVKE
jgi:hypothetical protein